MKARDSLYGADPNAVSRQARQDGQGKVKKPRGSTKAKTVQREGLYDRNSPANRARGRAETKAAKDAQSQANRRADGGLHSSASASERKSTKAKTGTRDSLYGSDPNRLAADKRAADQAKTKAKREDDQRRKADERETRKRSPRRSKDDTAAQQAEREKREREEREKREKREQQREAQRQSEATRQDEAKAKSEQKTPQLPEVPAERGGRDTAESLAPVSMPPRRKDAASVMGLVVADTALAAALSQLNTLS